MTLYLFSLYDLIHDISKLSRLKPSSIETLKIDSSEMNTLLIILNFSSDE